MLCLSLNPCRDFMLRRLGSLSAWSRSAVLPYTPISLRPSLAVVSSGPMAEARPLSR